MISDPRVSVALWVLELYYTGASSYYRDPHAPGPVRSASLAYYAAALINHDRILNDQPLKTPKLLRGK